MSENLLLPLPTILIPSKDNLTIYDFQGKKISSLENKVIKYDRIKAFQIYGKTHIICQYKESKENSYYFEEYTIIWNVEENKSYTIDYKDIGKDRKYFSIEYIFKGENYDRLIFEYNYSYILWDPVTKKSQYIFDEEEDWETRLVISESSDGVKILFYEENIKLQLQIGNYYIYTMDNGNFGNRSNRKKNQNISKREYNLGCISISDDGIIGKNKVIHQPENIDQLVYYSPSELIVVYENHISIYNIQLVKTMDDIQGCFIAQVGGNTFYLYRLPYLLIYNINSGIVYKIPFHYDLYHINKYDLKLIGYPQKGTKTSCNENIIRLKSGCHIYDICYFDDTNKLANIIKNSKLLDAVDDDSIIQNEREDIPAHEIFSIKLRHNFSTDFLIRNSSININNDILFYGTIYYTPILKDKKSNSHGLRKYKEIVGYNLNFTSYPTFLYSDMKIFLDYQFEDHVIILPYFKSDIFKYINLLNITNLPNVLLSIISKYISY